MKFIIVALIVSINGKGAGDNGASISTVKYIENKLQRYHDLYEIDFVENKIVNTNEINELILEIKNNKKVKYIIVATGSDAIKSLNKLNIMQENISIIASSHQFNDDIINVPANVKAISSHAINEDQIKQIKDNSEFVSIFGVNTETSIDKITEEWNKDNGKLKKKYNQFKGNDKLAIMFFGGNSIKPSGGYKFLTEEFAIEAADFVVRNMRDLSINKLILLDGPRAGAHIINDDGSNGRRDNKINNIIKAFIQILKKNNINVLYESFIVDEKRRSIEPNAYSALLSPDLDPKIYYYTADSISNGSDFTKFRHLIGKALAIQTRSTLKHEIEFAKNCVKLNFIKFANLSDNKYKILSPNKFADEPFSQDLNSEKIWNAIEKNIFKNQKVTAIEKKKLEFVK